MGVPCITVRDNTERAVTIRDGTTRLVGLSPRDMLKAARAVLVAEETPLDRAPELWDGRAGQRIADDLVHWLRPSLSLVATA